MKFRILVFLLLATVAIAQSADKQKAKPKTEAEKLGDFQTDPLAKEKGTLGRPATYTPKDATPAKPIPADLQSIVNKQFGSNFEIYPGDSFQTGDLDGDGIEDAIIVVRAEKPFVGEVKYNFKPIAPQDDYFGYGDPKIALSGEYEPWQMRRLILVIHGAGPQAWRADTPKAKFLIVNIPFNRISVTQAKLKKKTVSVINAEETSVMSSVLFWSGKTYKWRPDQELN
jgi:hypothetical protein